MDTFPEINDPIVLFDQDDRTYQSRVEDVGPEHLTIARPLDLLADRPVEVGTDFIVGWTSWRGIAFLPAELIQTRVEGTLRLWDLAITGAAWTEQRRDFVRIPAAGPVTVQAVAEPDGGPDGEPGGEPGGRPEAEAAAGQFVNISEAALCCTVDDRSTSDGLAVGRAVSVTFRLGSEDFEFSGSVVIRRPSNRSTSLVEVVVRFADMGKAADRLRREIFAQQLGARRR